jgi:tRNA threonylcarbamoyl adenosine modification protein (Sua5/YciO/YrdC/YwlC family)
MIDYIVEENPDDRILNKASTILRNGGLICFPTETNWVVCCDPLNQKAVEKLYQLKKIDPSKHSTILCSNFQIAMEMAIISDGAYSLIKKIIPGPYTFIFEAQKKITKILKASKRDHQIGIRFSPRLVCQFLLRNYGAALISSHISQDMISTNEDIQYPLNSILIEEYFGHQIDLIIDPGEYEFQDPTTIIDYTSGEPVIVRNGSGKFELFIK